jgi:selenium donor protein
VLKHLVPAADPNLLVGFAGADDAAVYRLDDETALILTVDYITPVVDDPFDFGRIAAANSLSDVYAMGGRPIVALNVAAFPEGEIAGDVLVRILEGGAETAREAGVVVAGGHTVSDREVKYGMSVVGTIHPDRVIRNSGARPGDALVLTKALGTGALSTKLKAGKLETEWLEPLVRSMTLLNKTASGLMRAFDAHACTDITGFGFFGHALEVAQASDVTFEISAENVPALPGAREAIEDQFVPGGSGTNRMFVYDHVAWVRPRNDALDRLLCDAQTSGGLLIALPEKQASDFVRALADTYPSAAVVGRVVERGEVFLRVV